MTISREVKQAALECGADLVGIASIDRFKNLPAEADPSFIKPDTRSVIVLGFQIPRGALRGIEEGTAWETFHMGSPTTVLIESTYLLCRWLESRGWEAVPLLGHSRDMRNQGVRVSPDKPEPDVIVDLEFTAHAAGLGEIGRGKFFLTPEFGPRQIFTAVLTDADFNPDPVFKGSICDECGACARVCPAKALSESTFSETPLCEGKARWYALRLESCRVCKTGTTNSPYCSDAEPMRVGAACGRACVAHLEDGGKLKRAFKNRFREPSCRKR